MLKKFLCLFLILALLPLHALGDTSVEPKVITPLADEEIPPTPDGIHYYLLLCSDRKVSSAKNPGNTDGIMLVAVDTVAHRVMLISFIRDMLLRDPENGYTRIHAIAKTWSIEDLMTTVNRHFGIRVENYILVNWTGVEDIIDALGGVSVTLTNGEAIRLRDKMAYMSDWAEPELKGAGTYKLRGYAAVTYMRIRSGTSIGGEQYDYRRTTRARNVVSSLASSLREISMGDALKLATSTVWPCIAGTNMTLADMAEAAKIAFSVKDAEIEQMRIPIDGTGHELQYKGAAQEIDVPVNREALQNFIFDNSFTVRSDDEGWD